MGLQHRSVNEAAESWLKAVVTLLKQQVVSARRASVRELLIQDLAQFEALADHMQMLLSTRPANTWEAYHWSLNFSFFLSQLIRRSEKLFEHLATAPDSEGSSLPSARIADLFRFLRLSNRLPNLY